MAGFMRVCIWIPQASLKAGKQTHICRTCTCLNTYSHIHMQQLDCMTCAMQEIRWLLHMSWVFWTLNSSCKSDYTHKRIANINIYIDHSCHDEWTQQNMMYVGTCMHVCTDLELDAALAVRLHQLQDQLNKKKRGCLLALVSGLVVGGTRAAKHSKTMSTLRTSDLLLGYVCMLPFPGKVVC